MAQVNTFDKFWKVRNPAGGSPTIRDYPVTANTTINAGDLVILTSGAVDVGMGANTTANGANAAYNNTNFIGVAMQSIVMGATEEATTLRTTVPVAILNDNCEVAYRLWSATPADAELADVSLGAVYEPIRWTSNPNTIQWYAVTPVTTKGCMILKEKSPDSASGDDYGIGWFSLLPSRRQG